MQSTANTADIRRGYLSKGDLMTLAGVTLLAAFLRFWQLDSIPPGLHYDEAFHGLQARDILVGKGFPVFFEGNFGVPPLFAYLCSLSFRLLGQTPQALRAVSAVVGVLSVPALYLLVWEVFGARALARLSAFLLAVSFQGILFSREGLEPHLVVLFLILTFYLLWLGWRTGQRWTFVLAGVSYGIGFYTYQAFWVTPLLVAPALAWLLWADRATWRRYLPSLVAFFLCAGVVLAPLGVYFLSESDIAGRRLGQIAVTSSEPSPGETATTVLKNVAATVAMFNWQGDADPRNNLPNRPMLDPFQSLGFLVGVGLCLWQWRKPRYLLWPLWLVVMVLPMTFSEYVPHFRRAIGVLPPVTVLAALGLQSIWQAFQNSRLPLVLRGAAPGVVLVLGLIAATVGTYRDYFIRLGPTNEFFYAFDSGLAQMAWYVNTLSPADRVYYLPADNRHFTLHFLAQGPVPPSFESRQMQLLAPVDERDTVYVVVTMEDAGALPFLRRAYPGGRVVHEGKDREGGVYFTAYRVPAGSRPNVAPGQVFTATVGSSASLIGYDLGPVDKDRIPLTLYWRAVRPMEQDYTVFVHLVGKDGLAAQRDSQPGRGSYPTSRWQPGETIVDPWPLELSPQARTGDYEIRVGMYLLATLQRVPATNQAGARWPDDAIILTKMRIER